MSRRLCAVIMKTGEHCQSPPLHDGEFCLMHSPEHAEEVQESRRLGGLRRRREVTLSGAYEFQNIETVPGIRRILEIAILDTLGMENSISRNRTLAYLAQIALRTLEVGELEERIAALEKAVKTKQFGHEPPIFDAEIGLLEAGNEENNR